MNAYCHQQCAVEVECSHLRNFCEVSIDEVRRAARDDVYACQSSALDRNSEGRKLKIGDNWSYAQPVKNFWLRHCSI